jgi:hypothetical protein
LALDLEGTLVSSAVSRFGRPGLFAFLEWAKGAFDRVVVFTSVRPSLAREVMQTVVEYEEAPAWFADVEIVEWEGSLKDLAFVQDASVEQVILVDDQERYVIPSQRGQWVAIAEWDAPYPGDDRELERVRAVLAARLDESTTT